MYKIIELKAAINNCNNLHELFKIINILSFLIEEKVLSKSKQLYDLLNNKMDLLNE